MTPEGMGAPPPPPKTARGMRLVAGLVAGLGLAGVVYLGVTEAQRARLVPDGAAAPELELQRHEGGTAMKLSDLRGQVVMLDFWATWCPPCREEMPALVKLAREYESQGLVFVAASRDDGPKATRLVESFITRTLPDLRPYVVYADDDVARAFQVSALPTLYFLDREGKVVDAQRGALSEDALRRRIERALKQP